MTIKSMTPTYRTRKKREFLTYQEVPDDLLDSWRVKYDGIFAAEAKARRLWGPVFKKSPDVIEAEIEARRIVWDAYVVGQLKDIATAKAV
jgi:hypothetical protein